MMAYQSSFFVAQIPTTVMAAIDASIGIKTAVNFNQRKNKMGTYCPPLAVFIDRCPPPPSRSIIHRLAVRVIIGCSLLP